MVLRRVELNSFLFASRTRTTSSPGHQKWTVFEPKAATLELEVSGGLKTLFVGFEEAHAFIGFEDVGLDGAIDLFLHAAGEHSLVILHIGEDFADGAAGNGFLDVKAARFIGIEEDVGFVDATEEIVEIAHDVLIGADKENTEIVGLAVERMERERPADFAIAVDELADLSVRVAGDVDEGGVMLRRFVEAVDRRDGEELSEGPVIEERLKDGEVAKELVAEGVLEIENFLRGRF